MKYPNHWKIIPIKRLFSVIGSGTTPTTNKEEYYNGKIPWIQSGDLHNYYLKSTKKNISQLAVENTAMLKLYKSPFISIAMYGASIGNASISQINAYTNQACCNLADCHENLNYCYYALLSFKDYIISLSSGGTQPNIKQEIIKNLALPVPPREEQDKIVRFLDWKVSEINKIIAIKKRKIELFEEYQIKTIEDILHSFPCNVTMRLKQLGMFQKGGGISRDNLVEEDNGYPAILYGDIYTQYTYKTNTINHFVDEFAYGNSLKIQKGNIVLAGTGETKEEIGKPILYTGDDIVAVGGDIIIFTPTSNVLSEYILYHLYSQESLAHRYRCGKGDIIVHIYPKTLGETVIPIVDTEEQEIVIEKINDVIKSITEGITALKGEIEILHEYKKRLISDVVTGQIDVRDIAIPDFEYVEETADAPEVAESDE